MFTDDTNPLTAIASLVAMKQLLTFRYYELLLILSLPFLKKLFTHLSDSVGDAYFNNIVPIFKKKHAVHNITAKLTYENNILYLKEIPHAYLCVMHDLYKNVIKDPKGVARCSVSEVSLYNENTLKIVLFNNQKKPYQIRPDIQLIHSHEQKDSTNEKRDNDYHTYTIQLIANNNDHESIRQYIEECVYNYEDVQLKQLRQQQIFMFTSLNTEEFKYPVYEEILFATSKSFNNLFFEGKDHLINKLDFFSKNKEKYLEIGMPYTLGMLFHGAPGTGKTSAIKAIAKYTNRHLVIIPLRKIKSIDTLRSIIMQPLINGIKIPNENRLYVFEEIDCGEWQNLIKTRTKEKEEEQPTQDSKDFLKEQLKEVKDIVTLAIKNANTNNDQDKPSKKDSRDTYDTMDLGGFLELLDGIIETPGRMMIITTNNINMIDPALTRPGRIDITIEFKRLTRADVNRYYRTWFYEDIPNEILEKIDDYKFSQAEIGNMFSSCDKNKIFETLIAT